MATKKAPRRGTVDRSGPFAPLDGKPLKVTRATTRRSPRAPKPRMHVAVVVRSGGPLWKTQLERWASGRPGGDWAAFVGTDHDKVIAEAMEAVARWGPKYEVWVGTLTGLVQMPQPRYEVKPL